MDKKPRPDYLPAPDETLEPFGQGRFWLLQKRRGYRFSLDAVLLAGLSVLRPGEQAVDLGAGCGIISLLLAQRYPDCTFVGVEYQESLAKLAAQNVVLNDFSHQIRIIRGDMRSLSAYFSPASVPVVVSNPPYRPVTAGRLNPNAERALARHEISGTLLTVAQTANYLLIPGGRLFLIYPAWRLVTLLSLLRREKLEPKTLRLIHSRPSENAVLVWLEARRGSGEELHVLPPLVIYGPDGRYTPAMAGLFPDDPG